MSDWDPRETRTIGRFVAVLAGWIIVAGLFWALAKLVELNLSAWGAIFGG